MKLHRTLQNYLFDNRLYVSPINDRYEVIDQNNNRICTGATKHTAVKKAMWLDSCPCSLARKDK